LELSGWNDKEETWGEGFWLKGLHRMLAEGEPRWQVTEGG
jgi:hypothetical protein